MLAAPSDSSQVNSSYDEDAHSKVLRKRDRHGHVAAKGVRVCQTKLNAINMTSSNVVELEGDVSTLQGELKDLRSLVEQHAKYINALLKGKGLDAEEHNDKEDSNEDDEDSDEDDDEDSDGTEPKLPTNTSTTPQNCSFLWIVAVGLYLLDGFRSSTSIKRSKKYGNTTSLISYVLLWIASTYLK